MMTSNYIKVFALAALLQASPTPAQPDFPPRDLVGEATSKLQALLRIDTTNPPGNEAQAAQLIAEWLRQEGLEPKVIQHLPGRASVVARLKGGGKQAPLLLLNHLDVVGVEPEHWKYPPFGGTIAEGSLWGRGSLDMKSLGVMQLIAFLELKRQNASLDRDVIFCATADEEAGGREGVGRLLEQHAQEIAASEVLNEGAAGLVLESGDRLMGIQTAERGALWVRIEARGKPGHGSLDRPDGATRRLIRALARLEQAPHMWEVIPEAQTMLRAIAPTVPGIGGWILANIHLPGLVNVVGPTLATREPGVGSLMGWTMNTTVLSAGSKVNVMPSVAAAEVDIRMLPGHSTTEALAYLKGHLADPDLEVKVLSAKEPSRSPADGALFAALVAASEAEYPRIKTTEVLTPGGSTDSSYFRELGARAYGVLPIVATRDQLDGIHGHNERITLDQLAAGTRVIVGAVAKAAGTRVIVSAVAMAARSVPAVAQAPTR